MNSHEVPRLESTLILHKCTIPVLDVMIFKLIVTTYDIMIYWCEMLCFPVSFSFALNSKRCYDNPLKHPLVSFRSLSETLNAYQLMYIMMLIFLIEESVPLGQLS